MRNSTICNYLRGMGRIDLIGKPFSAIVAELLAEASKRLGRDVTNIQFNSDGRKMKTRPMLEALLKLLEAEGHACKLSKPKAFRLPVSEGASRCTEFYASFEWRRLRYQTIVRYGGRCMACNRTGMPINVDHIKPIRLFWELRLDPENVQVLCADCNHGKGSWDQTDWRR